MNLMPNITRLLLGLFILTNSVSAFAASTNDNTEAAIFFKATKDECLKQFSSDQELTKYQGITEYVCPCLDTYLKAHYTIEDVQFMNAMDLKARTKTPFTDVESRRNEELLIIGSDAGTKCAKDFFDQQNKN